MKTITQSMITGFFITLTICLGQAWAGNLTIPNTFTDGTAAVAAEVNDNFSAVEAEVDNNDARITANTAALSNLQITRTLSIPAFAIAFPAGGAITETGDGIEWQFTYLTGGSVTVRAPADYAGGDVTFHIFFRTTTSAAGVVDFFIRPYSYDSGDGLIDPASLASTGGVAVSGTVNFGTLYEQSFTIPASRLTKAWWRTTIQREGSAATYSDNVVVAGAAFEYTAAQ